MPTDSNRPDVAVFIDFENVYVSVRDKLDANPNFESIMDRCEDFGRVVIARAYADWYRYPRVTSALYANSIEPIYVPTYYYDREMGRTGRAIKNSVDMNLCIDAMKTLFTNTNIAKFVLATGDRDFIPLVNSIRQQGKEVIIIGVGGAASSHLAQSADEFIFYETLVGKKPAGDLHKDQPRAKMPEKGREFEPIEESQAEAEPTPAPEQQKEAAPSSDVYDVLVRAINLARERGYVCSFGSLKLLMKELMGGEFKESRYKDNNGRPFAKFKDFVLEAERRNKVQVFTSGTVNEVFLPGEDPYKLSQFAQDLKEEPAAPVAPIVSAEVHAETRPTSPNGRRRRRRARGNQRSSLPPAEMALAEDVLDEDLLDEEDQAESEDVSELPEYTPASDLQLDDLQMPDLSSDPAMNDAIFESLLDRVEDEQAEIRDFSESQMADTPAASDAQSSASNSDEGRPFEDTEWEVLRQIVQRFERPIPFNQIHNALREARNSSGLNRTNEELRTLIKQAINTGVLERSGKGSNIVYRLAESSGDTPDQVELIEGELVSPEVSDIDMPSQTELIESEVAEAIADLQAEDEQAAPSEAEPALYTPEVAEGEQPTAIVAADASVAEAAPAKPSKGRSRRKKAEPVSEAVAEPVASGAEAEAKPKRPRRKAAAKAEPVSEAAAEPVSEAEAPAKPKRPRRKAAAKAEPVSEE